MQLANPDYALLNVLYESPRTLVFKARRHADRRAVVIKTVNSRSPSPRDLARLRREFHLVRRLQVSGVVRAIALEAWGNNLALVEEEFAGTCLADQLGTQQRLPFDEFFGIAIALASALENVHREIIHGDVNPRNILWNAETSEVRLIDFGTASEISRERQKILRQNVSNTSLPYIAPECSGRMNRDFDHRADLYSFGVIAYQLLTGTLPFTAHDRASWIYSHVTRQPRPLTDERPSLPAALCEIVLRLLAKNPEERYQSAYGLRKDLEHCRELWRATGAIAAFGLGQHDVSNRVRSPQRLCGREAEVARLLAAFQAVASGERRAVFVSGRQGIGKSMLVNEIRRAIHLQNGYFADGKFDQFGHRAPYAAFARAIAQLVDQLLSEPEEQLARWATDLREALAPNARLIVDLVPEVQRVIGQVPPLGTANPVEEQNRFHSTLRALIRTLAHKEHPLVLFLDDLQWSDAPTLALVKSLLSDREITGFMLIGAYREAATNEPHAVQRELREVEGVCSMEWLALEPLTDSAAEDLVADMLGTPRARIADLASGLRSHAQGNPLFLSEALATLHRKQMLYFDPALERWCWDTEQITQALPDTSVAEFLAQRLTMLSDTTQHWLKLAACLNATFELHTLAVIGSCSAAEAASGLWEAVQEGLVLPISEDYRLVHDVSSEASDSRDSRPPFEVQYQFKHDWVQQASYDSIDPAERRALHLRIGRLLLQRSRTAGFAADPIEVAQHLNEGSSLLESDDERLEVARVNLIAARKAKAAAAYRPAFNLLQTAGSLLSERIWQIDFECAFELLQLYAACGYLTGEHALAERACAVVLGRARTPLEISCIRSMQLVHLTYCNRMDEAIAHGLEGLRVLGVRIPARPSTALILTKLLQTKQALGLRSVASLDRAPEIRDARVRQCMRILIEFIPPTYLTGNDRLFAAVVLEQAYLSLKHGNCTESASAFASYAVLLAGLGQLRAAHEFGQLAVRLTDKNELPDARCRNWVLYALFAHSWARPWRELRGWFERAVQAGHESGDLLFTSYACGWVALWDPSLDLKSALEDGRKYLAIIERTNYHNARDVALIHLQFWSALLGGTRHELSLSDDQFDEDACEARMIQVRNVSGLGILALCRIKLCALYGAYARGFEIIRRSEVEMRALAGSPYLVEYCVHAFLVCVSLGHSPPMAARRKLAQLHRQVKRWARFCPENFEHYKLLMDAERARLAGDDGAAAALYDRAARRASQSGFAQTEALVNERAWLFYAARGLDKIAAVYLREAHYHYARLGANAKLDWLERRDPALFSATRGAPGSLRVNETADTAPSELDSGTVWKAVQTLSEEVTVEKLLDALLSVVSENAGATRCCLMLRDADSHQLLVQADTEAAGGKRVHPPLPSEQAAVPQSMIRYVARSGKPLVIEDVRLADSFARDPYLQNGTARSVLALPIVHRGRSLGVLYLENSVATHAFTPERLAMLTLLSQQAAISLQNARLYEHVQRMADSFSRFVPREFLRSLGRSHFLDIRLGESVQKVMTVLFSDIRDFTGMVERMSPTENIDFLNAYVSYMEPAILEAGGFVDSYIGDAIMALFESPPSRAVHASLGMLRRLQAFNAEHARRAQRPVQIGIGMNTGSLTLGTMGGPDRLKCGVVGDTVNVAARVESLTKRYRTPILTTASTQSELPTVLRDTSRFIDRVRVAGHAEPVDVFEVFVSDDSERGARLRELRPGWQEAVGLYYSRRFADAYAAFRELVARMPDDAPARLFEDRARRLMVEQPGEHWTGIEVLQEK